MNKDELIYLYFQGALKPKEKLEFEDLLNTDEVFKKRFEFESRIKKAIISNKKDELKEIFIKAESSASKKNGLIIFWAASIIIAIGLFSVFMLNDKEIDSDGLYAEYFEIYPNIIAPPFRGSDSISQVQKDFMLYEREDFKAASNIFKNRFKETNASYYLFYQGMSELELGNTNQAISILIKHKTFQDKFESYTNWYLALAYIKIGKFEKSKDLLLTVVKNKTFNYKKAKNLLKKLE